jgi:hypothetical protein
MDKTFTSSELAQIKTYSGTDLFCFTKDWWKQNREIFPDMLLGREGFDWVLRRLMLYEYPNAELTEPVVYHYSHKSQWCQLPYIVNNKGQIHNRNLAKQWAILNKFEKCLNIEPHKPLFKLDSQVPGLLCSTN